MHYNGSLTLPCECANEIGGLLEVGKDDKMVFENSLCRIETKLGF
jgi:hypothetical protein